MKNSCHVRTVLACAMSVATIGCGITAHNAELIRRHKNPDTEFKLYDYTKGSIAYTERTLGGTLAKTNNGMYCLRIDDLLYQDKVLQLTFPAIPPSRNASSLRAVILPKQSTQDADKPRVAIQVESGRFDDTCRFDRAMTFTNGMPTRFTFGVYWDGVANDLNHVVYTVGYKYDDTNRFTTTHCAAELPWNNRSHLRIAGLYANYLWTVPCDIVTSPYQALVWLLSPHWHD